MIAGIAIPAACLLWTTHTMDEWPSQQLTVMTSTICSLVVLLQANSTVPATNTKRDSNYAFGSWHLVLSGQPT